jgi:hypothetical protein
LSGGADGEVVLRKFSEGSLTTVFNRRLHKGEVRGVIRVNDERFLTFGEDGVLNYAHIANDGTLTHRPIFKAESAIISVAINQNQQIVISEELRLTLLKVSYQCLDNIETLWSSDTQNCISVAINETSDIV